MGMECRTEWKGGMGFESHIRQHSLTLDTKVTSGGQDQGPSPKELLLTAITGCTAMDVISILNKMREQVKSCIVEARSEVTSSYPAVFVEVKLHYRVHGEAVKKENLLKAVTLSMTKYCGVSAMISSPITYEVYLNEMKIGEGAADFSGAAK